MFHVKHNYLGVYFANNNNHTKYNMALSWNEIKSRATAFSKEWQDAANEDSQAKPFLIGFFEVFGITNKRVATFEHAVK